jgi:arylsulfatase A-like enzyme
MPTVSRRSFLASSAAALAQAPSRPNIIYIMSDDHASHAISAYGSRINKTPNIDRIANEGVRLDNCFVTNSICVPSRAAILTGQYSHKNGVYTLNDQLDTAKPTMAKMLQSSGYQTAMIGKWHLATDPQGFDHWNILPGQGAYYDPVFIQPSGRKQHKGYCTDLIGDFTLDWLQNRDRDKPFFLMCHHKAPHRAWDPAPKYKDFLKDVTIPEPSNLYERLSGRAQSVQDNRMRVGEDTTLRDLKVERPAGLEGDALRKWAYQLYIKDYLRCVQSVDDNVGRVLDYLDKDGLANNTLIVYTSDQGFFLGDHGLFDKRLMYEESLRMPFLARLPKSIKPKSVNTDISINVDFAPTFLDYAGLKPGAGMQGLSLRQNWEGKTPKSWRTSMYYRYWMHNSNDHHVPAHYGVRTKTDKLICFYNKARGMKGAQPPDRPEEWEYYDLKRDPKEMTNAIAEPRNAKRIASLKKELTRLQHAYEDQPA